MVVWKKIGLGIIKPDNIESKKKEIRYDAINPFNTLLEMVRCYYNIYLTDNPGSGIWEAVNSRGKRLTA